MKPSFFSLSSWTRGEKKSEVNKGDLMKATKATKARGCTGKINLGRRYRKQADRLSRKHGKSLGVYRCPHCLGYHLTTKPEQVGRYAAPLLYWTD